MRVLCSGEVCSGMTIRGVGRFLIFVDIDLVVSYTLGSGVGFSGELEIWFYVVQFCPSPTLDPPTVFTLRGFMC